MADATYEGRVYRETGPNGGQRLVVASGASIDIESGGEVDFEAGSALKIAGTAMSSSAAELNLLDGVAGLVQADLTKLAALDATAAELDIMDGVTATTGELNDNDLSAVGAIEKIKKLSISSTPSGSEEDTGWDLPANAVVLDVYVNVTTAEATGGTKTLDVGTNGSGSDDPDGFLDGLDVSSTGLKKGSAVATTNNQTYLGAAATHTRGELLTELLIAGQDTANQGDGAMIAGKDVASGGESITFTAGSGDWAEFRGDIYIHYIELA